MDERILERTSEPASAHALASCLSAPGMLTSIAVHLGLVAFGLSYFAEEALTSVTPINFTEVLLVSDIHTESPQAGIPQPAPSAEKIAPILKRTPEKKVAPRVVKPILSPSNKDLDKSKPEPEASTDQITTDTSASVQAGDSSGSAENFGGRAAMGVPHGTGSAPGTNYEQLIGSWLARHKKYPERARKRGITGEAVLRLVLARTGEVQEYSVLKKSEYSILNEEVEQMVARAKPFPPAPSNYPVEKMEFLIPVSFRLQ